MATDKAPRAAVVGAVNLDIWGRPDAPLVGRDSNPGAVSASLGGVGRNIAHDLALLGVPVSLFTALGQDEGARRVERSCQALGIDLTHALRVSDAPTSTYLFITDPQGEMELAVSDMRVCERMTPQWLASRMAALNQADVVVLDANLPAETAAFLAQNCAAPLFADPVSTAKAEKLRPILGKLHTLKANRLEAQALSGVEITDVVSLQVAAGAILDAGVRRVFISLGADGALAAQRGELLQLPVFPGGMKNTTGCGDAFTAALVWAYLEGLDLARSARAGLAAAAITLAGEGAINPALTAAGVRQLAECPGVNK